MDQLFSCFICLGALTDPRLCPSCSKFCCASCIERWLQKHKHQCPHCRAPLSPHQLVNGRFLHEIQESLAKYKVKEEAYMQQTGGEPACKKHPTNRLSYFCTTCGIPLCSDCALFDLEHSGHAFENLEIVYQRRLNALEKEMHLLQGRVLELQQSVGKVDQVMAILASSKDHTEEELKIFTERAMDEMKNAHYERIRDLLAHKTTLLFELDEFRSCLQLTTSHIENDAKSMLVMNVDTYLRQLQSKQTMKLRSADFDVDSIPLHYHNPLVPSYQESVYRLKNFSSHHHHQKDPGEDGDEALYSPNLESNGFAWRLKVYPNGCGSSRGAYLSVFLELCHAEPGIVVDGTYQYRFCMKNSVAELDCVREFSSHFQLGHCWGFSRFYRLQLLHERGFLVDDTLELAFSVRPVSYYQQSVDQRNYIDHLTARLAELEGGPAATPKESSSTAGASDSPVAIDSDHDDTTESGSESNPSPSPTRVPQLRDENTPPTLPAVACLKVNILSAATV